MGEFKKEKRKYDRYGTVAQVYFSVAYDLETKVKFQVAGKDKKKFSSKKYPALSKNIAAEGMCFTSNKRLEKENMLYLEVFLPEQKDPIKMEGEVRWSKPSTSDQEGSEKFDTGIKLITVNGQSVSESIYHDETHHLVWSIVLESVLGSFKKFVNEKLKNKDHNRSFP